MANNPKRYYWDSCVFLSYIQDDPGRADVIEAMLDAAKRRDILIYTSTETITEVAYHRVEKERRSLDSTIPLKLDRLWQNRQVVQLINFHQGLAYQARDLLRRSLIVEPVLKPKDAIHLVTAASINVDLFNTYDKKLIGCNGRFAFVVEHPSMPYQPYLLGPST